MLKGCCDHLDEYGFDVCCVGFSVQAKQAHVALLQADERLSHRYTILLSQPGMTSTSE